MKKLYNSALKLYSGKNRGDFASEIHKLKNIVVFLLLNLKFISNEHSKNL